MYLPKVIDRLPSLVYLDQLIAIDEEAHGWPVNSLHGECCYQG